ncbi:MAG: pyridoxine 5'-phosphate synthase, partial [Candidatus Margulisiibacteriota bacterium]
EGGLNLNSKFGRIIKKLQKAGIIVSLFIDPDLKQVETAAVLMADFIEIHTGKYSLKSSPKELEKIGIAVQKARLIGLRINAGHGLDYNNVMPIVKIPGIEELNIGFSIIARATEVGLKNAVREMKEQIL